MTGDLFVAGIAADLMAVVWRLMAAAFVCGGACTFVVLWFLATRRDRRYAS